MKGVKGLAAFVALAGAAAPALAQQGVKSGIDAWQHGDYAAAVSIWRPLAEKGDSDAEFDLGQAYRLGRGVSVDLAQAQLWLEKAANAGFAAPIRTAAAAKPLRAFTTIPSERHSMASA